MMCLACEQDAMWLAYLESKGLLKPDDPAAVEALFAAFPVQELPLQQEPPQPDESLGDATAKAKNPFSCDDPAAE
jgi:hypothetical protein